jgi:hypothetical protein
MGKALLGTHSSPATLQLLDEVRALRARVDELERALAEAEAARDAGGDGLDGSVTGVVLDEREPVAT